MLAGAQMSKRIGLLGGSFNPAHRGHRRLSLAAIDALGLDELWWLVSPGNPLKSGATDMAPFEARLASAKAMARHSPIRASDLERELGTRFTIDTVKGVKRSYPDDHFIWLLGSDTLPDFHKWRDYRGLARICPIAVLNRPGYDQRARAARAMGWLRHFVRPASQAREWTTWSAPAIVFLRLFPDPTSATAIRARNPSWHRQSHKLDRAARTAVPLFARRPLDRT